VKVRHGSWDKKRQQRKIFLSLKTSSFLGNLLIKKLENSGFYVRSVFDGEAGLKAVEKKKPSLILLDIVLPGMDGWEVLRQLKEKKHLKDIPVLIISNLGEPSDITKGKKAGAADYIIKADYSPQQIVDKVANILS